MSEEENSGAGRSRRRRRRRRGGGSGGGGGNGGGGGGGGGGNHNSGPNGNRNRRSRKSQTPKEKFGGREPKDADAGRRDGPLEFNAFELFCAYHLGLGEDNRYRDPSIKSVARMFGRSQDEIRSALSECGMDDGTVRASGYDVSLARLDIKVAPEGIDTREIAKTLFEEFVEMNPEFVDWTPPADIDESEGDHA